MHLIKLIILNFTSATNSERIKIARENHLHDSSETKLIIFGIIGFIIGYFIYWISYNYLLPLKYNLLILAFTAACITVLINNLTNIKNVLISQSEDEYLFSLPLTSSEIIVSKLFITYIKNFIYTFIIMFPTYYAFNNEYSLSETSTLIFLLTMVTIPFIPLIIGTIYAFVDSYYNQGKKKKKYNIIRILIILLILLLIYFLFFNTDKRNIDLIITKLYFLNPFILLYKDAIINNSFLTTIPLLFLPPILFYLFIKHLSFNYNYLLSRIRGVKINDNKEIIIGKKRSKINTIIHKEILTIFNNKTYFHSTIYLSIILTIIFFILSIFVDTNKLSNIHDFGIYLMLFLSFIGASSCTTISSLSLEKYNIIYFKSLPIKFSKILLAKFLVNILTSLPIIICNLLISIIFYKVSKLTILMLFISPLLLNIFISLLGLVLDFRFINYKEKNSNNIIKSRLVSYVPLLANLIVVGLIFLINPADLYNYILIIIASIILFLIILLSLYLLVSFKRILDTNIR